ncbi:unnamed protein product, partial [Mesorhabditis spiculigera]
MILLLSIVGLAAFLFHQFYWRRRGFPPGPVPLPFVGNMLEVIWKQPGYDAYLDWEKKYGPIVTYYMGTKRIVAITSYEMMKKYIVQQGDKFSDREHFQGFNDMYRGGNYGIIESDGQLWRDQRRFAISTLREFGMGKNLMQIRVLEEVDYMFARVEKAGMKLSAKELLNIAVGNIVNGIIFGYRFDETTLPQFWNIRRIVQKQQQEMPSFIAIILWPPFRHFPYFRDSWKRLQGYRDDLFGYFNAQIETHRKEMDFDAEESQCMAEVYLKEQRKHQNEPDQGGFSDIQLRNIVFDIWLAGLDTTVTTLQWGLNFCFNHPELRVFEKMHEELDRVVGRNRKVEMNDRNQLHYCNAVIAETQRFLNLVPQNLMRIAGEDVNIEGYLIPKGTVVIPQISCVLFNEELFPEPRKFKPERFINEDGTFKKVPELVPFSIGKRQCAGEGLARLELFLFFTNLVHKYELSVDELPKNGTHL